MRERDRLARTVHDGVLQTLSYVHRRGTDLGGEARELAAMAADQERLLRTLVSGVPTPAPDQVVDGRGRPAPRPRALRPRDVQVVTPADPVLLERRVAEELARRRPRGAGQRAPARRRRGRAWVLVEDHGEHVVVTVRDDGVGVAPGRLDEAAATGRMGVARSIRGRVNDLGGRAVYDSREGAGTTVELHGPKEGTA